MASVNNANGDNTLIELSPEFIKDLIKGVSTGLAITLPFFVMWLSFKHPKTFKLEYMKEISLLTIWMLAIAHLWPLKSLKACKDGVQVECQATAIPPEKAAS